MQPDITKMNRYCVVCGLVCGPLIEKCCTESSLVLTREVGFFRKVRKFYDAAGHEMSPRELLAIQEREKAKYSKEKTRQQQAATAAPPNSDPKREPTSGSTQREARPVSPVSRPPDTQSPDLDVKQLVWSVVDPLQVTLQDPNKIIELGPTCVPVVIDVFLHSKEPSTGIACNQAVLACVLDVFARKGDQTAASFLRQIANDEVDLFDGGGQTAYQIAKDFASTAEQAKAADCPTAQTVEPKPTSELSRVILGWVNSQDFAFCIEQREILRKNRPNPLLPANPNKSDRLNALEIAQWGTATKPDSACAWLAFYTLVDDEVFNAGDFSPEERRALITNALDELTRTAADSAFTWTQKGNWLKYTTAPASPHMREAALAYHTALGLQPGYRPALHGIAQLYDRLGDRRNALDCYRELARLYPDEELFRNAVSELGG